ncbi:unnamed protein product, partial [Tetraodon nigroviridis]
EKHYLKNSRCCKKCEPGYHVFSHCTDSQPTVCIRCGHGEYQPGWTEKTRCLQQNFTQRPENPVAEEPCRCFYGLQCSPINCEYCERIPTCTAGHGLEPDPAVKPREGARYSRAAPPVTRCADSLFLVRSTQTLLKEKSESSRRGVKEKVGLYNWMIRSMSSTADSCDQQDKLKLLSGSKFEIMCPESKEDSHTAVRQPLEVGENEDCSQAVSTGTPGICSCGSESRKEEKQKEESVTAQTVGDKSLGNGDGMSLSKSGTATAPLVFFSSPLTRSSYSPPCTPLPELGPQLCRDQTGIRVPSADSLLLGQESDGLTSLKTTSPSAKAPSEAPLDLSLEQGRGLSCKLSSAEAQLECPPESLHSQPTDPTLTSAQVSGSNNTTFISRGQVMNFSGEVIVVYVRAPVSGRRGGGAGRRLRKPRPGGGQRGSSAVSQRSRCTGGLHFPRCLAG